jgi:hypothetical protein
VQSHPQQLPGGLSDPGDPKAVERSLEALWSGSKPEQKPLSLVVVSALIALALWGLVAQVPRLGRRVLLLGRREGAFPPPFVGWIAFGAVLLLAIGTGVSVLFTRKPTA